jgi:hypothetical protein
MATVLYNRTTDKIVGGPFINGYLVDGLPGVVRQPLIELTIIENEPLAFNPESQRLVSEWQVDTVSKTRTLVWTVIDKTIEELNAEEETASNLADAHLDGILLKRLLKRILDTLTDEEAMEFTGLFNVFRQNTNYLTGDRFQFKGNLYKVQVDHLSDRKSLPDADTDRYRLINK